MTITCHNCEYDKNPNDTEFCEACGSELGGATAPVVPPVAPTIVQSPEPISPAPAPTVGTFTPPAPPTFPSFPTAPTSIPSAATARLISKQPSSPTSEFLIDGSNAIIGKFDPDMGPVDIDLEGFSGDETISRNHAEIYQEGGAWKIKDLGSTNGVFIKRAGQSKFGARITVPEILNSGDEVAIAKIRFLFQSP